MVFPSFASVVSYVLLPRLYPRPPPWLCRKQNDDDLAAHDLKIVEGKEKFGDVEVFERQRDRAEYLVKIGDVAAAQAAFAGISSGSKLSTGQKIDVAISQTRLALAHADWPAVKEKLALAKECVRARTVGVLTRAPPFSSVRSRTSLCDQIE
jgi:hypothetical protein